MLKVAGLFTEYPNERGQIVRFLEKPRPEQVFSKLVSAGVMAVDPGVLEVRPDEAAVVVEHQRIAETAPVQRERGGG